MLDIKQITPEKLEQGDFEKELPQFYALKAVVENNSWHIKQSVFDHSVKTFKSSEYVLSLEYLKNKHLTNSLLDEKVGKLTKRDCLKIAMLFHDVAKKICQIDNAEGKTSAPHHENIGSIIVEDFIKDFDLESADKVLIKKLVFYHGLTHDTLALSLEKQDFNTFFDIFKKIVEEDWVLLYLLIYADMMGSDVERELPEAFKGRVEILTKFLEAA